MIDVTSAASAASAASWLDPRAPEAPRALVERMRDAAGALGAGGDPAAPALEGAARLLERVLAADDGGARALALDLLAADALVTWAFERLADEPERLDEWSARAMRRLATLAEPPAGSPGEG